MRKTTEALPRCAHGVCHAGVKHSGKTNNPACSVCMTPGCARRPRKSIAPGTRQRRRTPVAFQKRVFFRLSSPLLPNAQRRYLTPPKPTARQRAGRSSQFTNTRGPAAKTLTPSPRR